MMKRSLAVLLTGLMLITSTYPVNAMGADVAFEIQQEETASEDVSEGVSQEEIGEENTESESGECSEEEIVSEEVSEVSSEEAAEDVSEVASEEATEDVSKENSEEVSEEISEEDTEAAESAENIAGLEEAREALRELAESQDLMALVYLTESYEMKQTPEKTGITVRVVYSGDTVAVKDVALTDGVLWYEVDFLGEETVSGYIERANLVYADERLIAWETQYLGTLLQMDVVQTASMVVRETYSDKEIESFPESYRSYIREMKAAHPNWHFVPFNVAVDFDVAAENEVGERSLVHSSVNDSWKGEYHSPNWYYAKPFIIRHYMDPRNFLGR